MRTLSQLGVTLTCCAWASLLRSYLLQTEFSGQPCAWCYLSATLSLSLMATVVSGLPARRLQQVRHVTQPVVLLAGCLQSAAALDSELRYLLGDNELCWADGHGIRH